jgi:hypothetical protein
MCDKEQWNVKNFTFYNKPKSVVNNPVGSEDEGNETSTLNFLLHIMKTMFCLESAVGTA